jgi:hypothetical protein
MLKPILSGVLMVACTACSHLPFMHKSPAADASSSAASGRQAAVAPAVVDATTTTSPPTSDPSASSNAGAGDTDALIAAPSGYETAAAARQSLEARTDVQTHANPQGWWIVEIPTEHEIWAFTPDDHPAHPAAVAREAVNEHGVIRIRMAVLCTASKQACDALVDEFKPLNEEMRKRLQQNL